MKADKIIIIILLLTVTVLVFSCFGAQASAETSGDNDNFGDLNDLLDITEEKLTLKDGSGLIMSDTFLTRVAPASLCSEVIACFENENVVICSKDGTVRSADDTVCTSDTVKLVNKNGGTSDSRVIAVSGDVNCDGEANTSDVTLILRYDAGGSQLTDELFIAADVSLDEDVDSVDATFVLKYDCGLISNF